MLWLSLNIIVSSGETYSVSVLNPESCSESRQRSCKTFFTKSQLILNPLSFDWNSQGPLPPGGPVQFRIRAPHLGTPAWSRAILLVWGASLSCVRISQALSCTLLLKRSPVSLASLSPAVRLPDLQETEASNSSDILLCNESVKGMWRRGDAP